MHTTLLLELQNYSAYHKHNACVVKEENSNGSYSRYVFQTSRRELLGDRDILAQFSQKMKMRESIAY